MVSRRLAREAVLKALFAVDLGKIPLDRVLADVLADAQLSEQYESFAREWLKVRWSIGATAIDHPDMAVDWTVERMATIDRNILRLAIYEIFIGPTFPTAWRSTKRWSSRKSTEKTNRADSLTVF